MPTADAVNALRRYEDAGPWRAADLVALADELLAAADLVPDKPTTERTLRFYVARGVVTAPYGKGAGSSWGYRHLVELLGARVAQRDGDSLETIAAAREEIGGRALERRVAERLGAAFRPRLVRQTPAAPATVEPAGQGWRRIVLGDGAELHLQDGHLWLREPARLDAVLDLLTSVTRLPSQESS